MTNKQRLPLLILMVIFSPLAIDIFLPALPVMAAEFVVPMNEIQWSITIFILSLGFGFYHLSLFGQLSVFSCQSFNARFWCVCDSRFSFC